MNRIDWDLMRPQDIEIRPAQIKDNKATLLLYQDSRNTMDALDRNFGEFGWKIEYKDVAGQIYGRLSIKDPETHEWIAKEDTGEESNISAEKGMSSDILKRCAVRFGYGRELYTAPRIVVDDDGYGCKGYRVSKIDYNEDREIIRLIIVNRFGKSAFDWVDDRYVNKPVAEPKQQGQDNPQVEEYLAILRTFCKDRINAEPIWKNDIIKFGETYSKKIRNGWHGPFRVNDLYNSWVSKRKVS